MSVELASRQHSSWREGPWVTLADGQAWSFPPIQAHRRREPGQPALEWIVGGRRAPGFGFTAERIAAAPPGSVTDEDTRHLFALALLHNYCMTQDRAAELVAAGGDALEAAVLAPALAATHNPRG